MNQTKELKPKISELKDEYEQRLKELDKSIEYWKNAKMSNSQDHVAGKYYELEKVVKDLEELLKWYQKQRFKN